MSPSPKKIGDTYDALSKHLEQPRAESFQAIAKQTNTRDRLLEDFILAQVEYVWAAGDSPSAVERIKLLEAHDRFTKSLKQKRGADTEEQRQIAHLADLHEKFNKLMQQTADGKSVPGYYELEADAQKTIARIMKLRSLSSAAYREFLAVVEPMEKATAALFNAQMERGQKQIAYQLEQEGHTGNPFRLFKPKTGNEQWLMNKIIGKWLIGELGIVGARESSPWVDWKQFQDFDYEIRGLAPGACTEPEKKPDDQSAVPPVEPEPEEELVCTGGGLLGAMDCVAKRIGG